MLRCPMQIARVSLSVCAMLSVGMSCSAAELPPPNTRSGAEMPSDSELERSGARIGAIEIYSMEIFDLSQPGENNVLFRAANRLHLRTRRSAIRAQLLFRSGDLYSRRLLDETERNLRQLDFLREPRIRAVHYENGIVDLEVVTHDVWTLQPGISYSRSGGTNASGFGFTDSNLLGYGKFLQVGHSEDIDRRSNFIQWGDPNVWGSRWTDTLMYSDNSDGRDWSVNLMRPFYSLETREAYGALANETDGVVTRYSLGHPYDAYNLDWHQSDINYGIALGRLGSNQEWSTRLIGGWHTDRSNFSLAPSMPLLAPLPANRDLSYPYVSAQLIQNDFVVAHNYDQIIRTEDLHYGLDASTSLGWATPEFGSDRHALILNAASDYGASFAHGQDLFVGAQYSSRLQQGAMQDELLSLNGSYYWATSERTKLLLRFSSDIGHDLDSDHYLDLGGDTGLRGYPLRYQMGAQRALFTAEERLYTNWYLWKLLHVGAAAFYDMGRTWGSSPIDVPQLGLLRDAGVGLRLGNARASFAEVIHIDVATPLDGDNSISRLQFLVTTENSF
jgi:hypothetical protein